MEESEGRMTRKGVTKKRKPARGAQFYVSDFEMAGPGATTDRCDADCDARGVHMHSPQTFRPELVAAEAKDLGISEARVRRQWRNSGFTSGDDKRRKSNGGAGITTEPLNLDRIPLEESSGP